MPEKAYFYPIPYTLYEKYKIRRYGFHGTSHRYVSGIMCDILGHVENTKIITCHIGNGASIAAVKDGKVIDTSMGFTPLDGVEMGTRCGSIDPSIVTFIMKHENISPDDMNEFMNKECGFLGVSGQYADSRDIEKAILEGDKKSLLAATILAYQIQKYIGSYTAAMNGLDAVVFTAGMGENNPELRERVCTNMEYYGIEINREINARAHHQPNIIKLSTLSQKLPFI
jgi:acetate kinase